MSLYKKSLKGRSLTMGKREENLEFTVENSKENAEHNELWLHNTYCSRQCGSPD